jgi:RNA polymerase primary sigma factor
MPKYRLDIIHTLARQIAFAPVEVRRTQLASAETLVGDLDPTRSYPPDFITFRVTGFKPKGRVQRELLTGLALEHDLCLLIEDVSATMSLRAADEPEPVLSIDDTTARFNVTSKTIQRWRRKGLVSRRFIFADGKSRVGFLLSSIERFIARNSLVVRDDSNLATMSLSERDGIVRHARRLAAADWNLAERDLTLRLARRYRRSSLTILHTLRKHDVERPDSAVLCALAGELEPRLRSKILKAWRRGRTLSRVARHAGVTRSAAYRAVIDERISRLSGRRAKFHDDELYHGDDAEAAIETIVRSGDIDAAATREELRVPANLPPYLADLYRTPLLSPKQERALFLQFNYRKYRFTMARRAFDPELVCSRDLKILERIAGQVDEVKNRIVAANLRLVVSVARKHAAASERSGGPTLMELVSEGNLILMRAVEGFDLHRNVRFSTYATLALMKGFARLVPEMRTRARRTTSADVAALELADRREAPATDRLAARDEVARLLSLLTPIERVAIAAQFGLDGAPRVELGNRRTRQVERDAIEKLRRIVVGSTRG